ncbi:MAG TPA: beta-ketoacyl-[acyl-carrier-protein] synthase II, partial [Planctomycetota bacterium]|nr:beta-ketoacyl-[acyl-carrier-protein] synthase II [Planctomycetota bacterium]
MRRRIVVTGFGALAPNGSTAESFWKATCDGKSGIGRIEGFDPTGFQVQIAGEVKDFDPAKFVPNRKALKVMGRNIRLGVAASRMAMEHSGLLEAPPEPPRFGVVMGSGLVPTDVEEVGQAILASLDEKGRFDLKRFGTSGQKVLFPLWLLKHLPNMVAAHVSIFHQAQGPNNTIVTACSASTQAIGEAMRIIERGDADVMLAGGSDSRIDPLSVVAYSLLGALSTSDREPTRVSRPFDRGRDGFVLGEGAGVLVLESEEHARKRGATIFAECVGYGSSFDAFAVTQPEPEGRGAVLCMREALKDARLSPSDVDYISAHGTSTVLNDLAETVAVKKVFGACARRVPMSSIKSMIGHLIGAAGALEAVVSVLAIRDGIVPPTINLETPDPQCDLDYVPNTAR